ncbi:MAG: hypothetical protein KME06_09555 [Kastovskya adunca ATA6-11-RM4]|jgi:hypothetical protein|nr:hypothetical protein [Kastovskya adunca ATA6-11-RM4]
MRGQVVGRIYTAAFCSVLHDLLEEIRGYESEVFSASKAALTDQEIELIAAEIIQEASQSMISGYSLMSCLSNLRYGNRMGGQDETR